MAQDVNNAAAKQRGLHRAFNPGMRGSTPLVAVRHGMKGGDYLAQRCVARVNRSHDRDRHGVLAEVVPSFARPFGGAAPVFET